MSDLILGNPLDFTNKTTCLNCAKYFSCKDPHKSSEWSCTKFELLALAHPDDLLEQAQVHIDLTSTMNLQFGDDDPDELGEFEAMVRASLNDNRLLPMDLNVSDADFPEAKNYYDWTCGSGHIKFVPFSRQLWVAAHVFAELCPYCSDKDWFHNVEAIPVDYKAIDMPEKLQFMDYGVCPSCGEGRSEMWRRGDLNIYSEMALCLGQRAGKSIQTAGLASYHIHKLLKTVRPSEYYGLAGSTTLTHTYTGLQFKRAYALLWTPIRDTILDSPWFKAYHAHLKTEGDRIGEELVTIKDTFINWRRSRFAAAPAAPNTGTLRGDTRAGGGIDELGLFKFGAGAEDFVTISADEIHASITNSLATVRTAASKMLRGGENNTQQGLMFNLSSPMSVFDKIMTLVRASKGSRTLFGLRLPTWEINPLVTREDLQIYWDTDPVKAERDFGANPPLAASPFFEDKETIANMLGKERNRVQYEYINRNHPRSGIPERAARVTRTFPLQRQPPTLMTLDAGVSNNSFCLSVSLPVAKGRITPPARQTSAGYAKKPKRPPVPGSNEMNLNTDVGIAGARCQTLLTIEVMPPPGGRIHFERMYKEAIVPLLQPFNVKVVIADRWNSILMLDRLRDEHGVDTFQYSLRYKDFEAARSYVEGGMLSLPRPESLTGDPIEAIDEILSFDQQEYPTCFLTRPIDHLVMQFLTVQDTGRVVDKGPNLTDDSFRTVMLAMHFLRDIEFVNTYLSGSDRERSSGMGLVAAPGGEAQQSVSLSGDNSRALIAMPGGGGGAGESGNVFARTRR
jgi:hypothetical protein